MHCGVSGDFKEPRREACTMHGRDKLRLHVPYVFLVLATSYEMCRQILKSLMNRHVWKT
jgi:hypothetical protein